ncbi:MAG: phage putative head morphosis protein family [Clostridiaceae bacterium]|jgi:SPP1 gp7 family putative phage head morphogenesis protein|nr:phage putative head morphosis protein family [Clostridiaceae bacterium]
MANIDKQYKDTIEQIRLDSEDYADSQMQDIYKQQNDKLDEILTIVALLYVKYALDGLLKLTPFEKNKILDDIKSKLTEIGKDLGETEINKVTDILEQTWKDTYYKSAYVMEGFGINIDTNFSILKKEFIDTEVNRVYKGEMFSDRIWKNKASMIDKLYRLINEASTGKTTIDKISKEIKDTFGVTAYESRRLVRTEVARNAAEAQLEIGKNSGCEQVMWSATLDMKTATLDASYDGKVWDINEDHPMPPLHPLCRCVLLNIPYTGWIPSKRLDNESRQLIDYQDYGTWLKNKGINDSSTAN